MKLQDFLGIKYKVEGRDVNSGGLDCWGLTRGVRHYVYKKSLLSLFKGVNRFTPILLTKSALAQTARLRELLQPEAGCIIIVSSNDVCIHIAVCVLHESKLKVLDTEPEEKSYLLSFKDFKNKFKEYKIKYYD